MERKLVMIGIEFKIKTTYEKILYDILKDIDFDNYKWEIIQQEILYENNYDKQLPSQLSGSELEKEISSNGNYYVFFLNLQAYLKNSATCHIETYNDFVNSNCELIILFSDNRFIEIYVKSEKLKQKIFENLDSKKINYNIKTRENDGRVVMRV